MTEMNFPIPLDPMEIDKLYNKNPEELSDSEIDKIIESERQARLSLKTKKPSRKSYKPSDEAAQVSIEDLDLEIKL